MIHALKITPEYFEKVISGEKKYVLLSISPCYFCEADPSAIIGGSRYPTITKRFKKEEETK